jgi:hypothetical protein
VLGEILLYLNSGASRLARRSGLLTDAIGLWSRSRRRKRQWALHYARCHGFVREVLADRPLARKVVILGSGLVEDVPLDVLAARFETILLVDIVHLKPVRRRLEDDPRFHGKLVFVELDLTGLLEGIHARTPLPLKWQDPLDGLMADPDIDLVISAMCLSQLPRAIDKQLAQTSLTQQECEAICRSVVEQHLSALAKFPCETILLSDTSYTEIAADGRDLAQHDLLWGVALPEPQARWEWEVAPKGEVSGGISYRHQVGAWHRPRPKT